MDDIELEPIGFVKQGVLVTQDGVTDPLAQIEASASWSDWVPLDEALAVAPRLPGVYMAREMRHGQVIYVGMAGERRGSRDRPQGIRGRLSIYVRGKGMASGLGEAALDRALADPQFLQLRSDEVERGEPIRAKEWGREALAWAALSIRWATTADKASAVALERQVIGLLANSALWNRLR